MNRRNGFLLTDALFGLFILIVCISLLLATITLAQYKGGFYIHETIQKEWFYTD